MKTWNTIVDALWFMYHSPKFMNKSFFNLLFHEHLLLRTRLFCKSMREMDGVNE